MVSHKEEDRPDNQNAFRKRLGMWKYYTLSLTGSSDNEVQGVEVNVASQLWNRLEHEGEAPVAHLVAADH